MNNYRITDDCIACGACAGISPDHFEMSDDGSRAEVVKQPSSPEEQQQCEEALEACPVDAIIHEQPQATPREAKPTKPVSDGPRHLPIITIKSKPASKKLAVASDEPRLIKGADKVRATLEKHPQLKPVLMAISPAFARLQKPILYNTVARYASFHDAARVAGVSVCAILHTLNEALGVKSAVVDAFPECIKEDQSQRPADSTATLWNLSKAAILDYRNTDDSGEWIEQVTEQLRNLEVGKDLVILSDYALTPLEHLSSQLGYRVWSDKVDPTSFRLAVRNDGQPNWLADSTHYDVLDVRAMHEDPFDIIIKRAYRTEPGGGFILVQKFRPDPMINMLTELGFEYRMDQRGPEEFWLTFHKPAPEQDKKDESSGPKKVPVVLQSATPVAYPILMRLLQSQRLRDRVTFQELKVWEETEKHLAWVVNGKADISFSALITSLKLPADQVRMPAAVVWDNFTILTRGYEARSFEDLKGHEIYTPLFREAPPTTLTRYLMKKHGYDPDDFTFTYGKPFGRPKEIMAAFVSGKADTVMLREPEASFALQAVPRDVQVSELPYIDLWKQVHHGQDSFPNATVLVKNEFVRNHPDVAQLFLEETAAAIEWVKSHPEESAKQCADIMRQSEQDVLRFLQRVHFNYVTGDELVSKATEYIKQLHEAGLVRSQIDPEFFKLPK